MNDNHQTNRTRMLQLGLLVVALAVWAAVAWKATRDSTDMEPRARSSQVETPPDDRLNQAYDKSGRDPFLPLLTRSSRDASGIEQAAETTAVPLRHDVHSEETPWYSEPALQLSDYGGASILLPAPIELPPLTLRGVVGGAAILDFPDGTTTTMYSGDSFGDMKLLGVHTGFVTIEYEGQSFMLFLD